MLVVEKYVYLICNIYLTKILYNVLESVTVDR